MRGLNLHCSMPLAEIFAPAGTVTAVSFNVVDVDAVDRGVGREVLGQDLSSCGRSSAAMAMAM